MVDNELTERARNDVEEDGCMKTIKQEENSIDINVADLMKTAFGESFA